MEHGGRGVSPKSLTAALPLFLSTLKTHTGALRTLLRVQALNVIRQLPLHIQCKVLLSPTLLSLGTELRSPVAKAKYAVQAQSKIYT